MIVCGDLCDDLHAGFVAGNVDREDRDSGCVRLLNYGHDGLRVAGAEHDRAHFLDDEVFDLVALLRHVFIGADDDRVVAVLLAFLGDVVADHLKEWVFERQK